MITRATLAQLFGEGATQDSSALTFPIRPGLTAEGILVELLVRLLNYQDISLETEDGQALQTEQGQRLTFALVFTFIESELYKIEFSGGYLIHRIFLGFNSENI